MKTPWILPVILFSVVNESLDAGAPIIARSAAATRASGSTRTSAQAARSIERMRKHFEEWGTVNVSEPLIYPVNGQFSLGADKDFATFKEYYASELASVTGAVGQLDQMAFAASASATYNAPQFTQPPAQATGAQSTPATQAGTGATANQQFPLAAPQTASPSDAPASQAKGYLDQGTFHKPGELLATAPNGNAPRSAVSQSATDKITELLLRTLANPAKPADGMQLYLAIFQVTCNPGWRTMKGYMADVFLHWEYAQHLPDGTIALSLSNDVPTAPSVVAILPLVDAQNMDLRNSQRELYSFLTALAASGALGGGNAAGKGVLDYIHSYQKDAASRNAMPVVNSYSTAYGMGFRFSPSFVAISDPARKKSAAANMLIPTSFPVLAVIGMRKEDAGPQRSQWPEVASAGYGELAFHTNFRWLMRDRYISLIPWRWHFPERRENEQRRLNVAQENQAALSDFTLAKQQFADESPQLYTRPEYQLLRTDFEELTWKMGANWSYSPLSKYFASPKLPEITECEPKRIDPTVDTTITITGKNLKTDGVRVFLGGQECTVIGGDEKGIVVLFKAARLSTWEGPTRVRLASNGKTTPVSFERVTNLVVASKLAPAISPIPVDLTRQKRNDDKDEIRTMRVDRDEDGNIKSINFSELGTLASKDALDAAAKILSSDSGDKSDDDKTNSDGTTTPTKNSTAKK